MQYRYQIYCRNQYQPFLKEPRLVYRLVNTIKHYDTLINIIIKKAKDMMRAPQRHLDGGQRVYESHPGLDEKKKKRL